MVVAFTSDYRHEESFQRILAPLGEEDIAKEAKIWRRRRTHAEHKGNRAIIVNRLNPPLSSSPLHRAKRKADGNGGGGPGSNHLGVNYPATDSDRTHFSIILSSRLTLECRYSRGICIAEAHSMHPPRALSLSPTTAASFYRDYIQRILP